MRPLILAIILTAFIVPGCKKYKHPPKEKFPLSYQFINEGDANVRHVNFATTTIFPNDTVDTRGDSISIINWHDAAFSNVGTYGIVTLPLTHRGFVGCIAQFKLTISFKEAVYSPLFDSLGIAGGNNPNGYTFWRTYSGPETVVASPADNIIKFRWPSDTAIFTEVRFLH